MSREEQAAAWREGYMASHNQDRGTDMDWPPSEELDYCIDAWNPYTGDGCRDPFEDEE